ncbi:putative monovalent cation/H+ antiporter subunit E [Corynebacterium efficiens YS-314]|uniref:Uncharacterized protein n=1 Tax=Corynebacterium efficiens (strain DSM 44549 / YS-314 / AJ 12310 / JCM 11189 / NBRC 100395) TaxID=196164 RepID=Q8FTZ3_COREF|nr:Na+/H+ antiporter subunit E [Corynebacterium efficiens]EEW48854.1 putative monovalent cation/H+ antiporter subunit E [Corynebacterium efficiens YS-314]BAC17039.1 hypothetical protein [Corynebacterium efficiens YS-314]
MIDSLTWPFRIIGFLFWYIGALVTANIAVLKDVLTPGQDSAPGIGLFESRSETEFEFSLISVLITLTPGTLSLGTTTRGEGEPRKLYVHSLYSSDADALRAELKDMEDRMLKAVRIRKETS